jgi:hypothetical protein
MFFDINKSQIHTSDGHRYDLRKILDPTLRMPGQGRHPSTWRVFVEVVLRPRTAFGKTPLARMSGPFYYERTFTVWFSSSFP